jgi:hypothetical protein
MRKKVEATATDSVTEEEKEEEKSSIAVPEDSP